MEYKVIQILSKHRDNLTKRKKEYLVNFSYCTKFLPRIHKYKLILTVCYYHVTYELQSESTLYSLPECQGTPCSNKAPYLKFKWQQRDSNTQPLSS